jgi:hypothetical protein
MAAAGLLGAGGLAVAARPAAACGMIVWPMQRQPPTPALLLSRALNNFHWGRSGLAMRYALDVLRSRRASAAQKTSALTVVAWVAWQQDNKALARLALQEARRLDGGGRVIEAVLTRAADPGVSAGMRKALEG